MPHELRNIVVKELREIVRDPRLLIGMIIVPVLMMPLMGVGIRSAMEAAQEEVSKMETGLLNQDHATGGHNYSDLLYALMIQNNMIIRNSTAPDANTAVSWAVQNDIGTLVVLPPTFSEEIGNGTSVNVSVYQVLSHFGFDEMAGSERVNSVFTLFNNIILHEMLGDNYSSSNPIQPPVPANVVSQSVIKGEVINVSPSNLINSIYTTGLLIPMAFSIVIVLAAQLAATSVAMEKEQKTLEVLLTLPIKRINILLGKLSGVILVSALATIAMLLSFGYYMSSLTAVGGTQVDLASIGLTPDMTGYALLAASLFLSIISALALAVLLAAYTKDVRSAQSLLGVLFLPIFLPAFLLMFAPVEILPAGLQAIIYAIPFSYPSIASKALYTKDYAVVALGVVYQIVFTAIVLIIAARFFASEKIMTAKLKWGRKRKAEAEME
jgi:ABC-2 type transport system permease protein